MTIETHDGELVDDGDIDALADALERVKRDIGKLYRVKDALTEAIITHIPAAVGRTHRVRGQRVRLKVVFPAESFDGATLKRLWSEHPDYAARYLRVESIAPNMREVQKLKNEVGPAQFMDFREQLLGANRGITGRPTITIEEE